MDSKGVTFEGKTLDDAVRKGLDALGLSRAEVMITVMEEGSSGFLGIGSRPYKVRMMPRPRRELSDREERSGRGSRGERGGRGGRSERGVRGERGERSERGGRGERSERGGRGDRERGGRNERGNRNGRSARPQRDGQEVERREPIEARAESVREPREAEAGGAEGGGGEGRRRRRRRRGGGGGPREGAPEHRQRQPEGEPRPASPVAVVHDTEGHGEIPTPDVVEAGRDLAEKLFQAMGFEARVTAQAVGDTVEVRAEIPQNGDLVTGEKGEVRQAIQHLLNRMLNRGGVSRHHLQLEINDFWAARERELQELARRLADEAAADGSEKLTEYLNAQERRVIHVALRDDARVRTYGLGDGLIKKVAISPATEASLEKSEG